MTGFLGRLARRVVASADAESVAPSLEPMSATPSLAQQSFGFVEEHIERLAETPPAAEPSAPRREPQASGGSEDRPSTVARQQSPSSEPAVRPTRPLPQPAAVAQPPPADAAVARSDDRPAAAEPREVELPVVAAQPAIQRVIEVNEIPGPVVPVVRRVTVPAADSREPPTTEQPSLMSTPVAEPEPAVVFVPGEPLGRMGLDPLHPDELLSRPEVADAVRHDSTVHVHIGRVEVTRPAAAPPTPPPIRPGPNLLSLDDYLAERSASAVGRGHR